MTDDATRFVEQQLRTSFNLASTLETRFKDKAKKMKPKDLQSLTGAWRTTVDIGRQALRLDEQKDNSFHFHLSGGFKPGPQPPTIDLEICANSVQNTEQSTAPESEIDEHKQVV